jgi:hypothetical protein
VKTSITGDLQIELGLAEKKAWDALSRYKFVMFGYWCAVWVHLNRISGEARPNPWRELVLAARKHLHGPTRDGIGQAG